LEIGYYLELACLPAGREFDYWDFSGEGYSWNQMVLKKNWNESTSLFLECHVPVVR
jgi:hypothetical protein